MPKLVADLWVIFDALAVDIILLVICRDLVRCWKQSLRPRNSLKTRQPSYSMNPAPDYRDRPLKDYTHPGADDATVEPMASRDARSRAIELRRSGLARDAADLLELALRDDPGAEELYYELANSWKDLGEIEPASASFRRALIGRPEFPQALNNFGGLLRATDDPETAMRQYGRAGMLMPGHPGVQYNLGNARHAAGRLESATRSYRRAVLIDPSQAAPHQGLGTVLGRLGQVDGALASFRAALRLDPGDPAIRSAFAGHAASVVFTAWDSEIAAYLITLLEQRVGSQRAVVRASVSMLRHHPVFGGGFERRAGNRMGEAGEALFVELSKIRLLIQVMETGLNSDLGLELFLTDARRHLLLGLFRSATKPAESVSAFLSAMAKQCFMNEYLFFENEEEIGLLQRLESQIEGAFKENRAIPEAWILIIGAYRPLRGFSWAGALEERYWSPSVESLVSTQVRSPRDDLALCHEIPRLTSVVDRTSRDVRDLYEANPYPRWQPALGTMKPRPAAVVFREMGLDVDLDDDRFTGPLDILVAGCGTGQQALGVAARFLNCSVLAVDLSFASLAYASRRTRSQGVRNVNYARGDILELGTLDRQFDIIECVGVLHHMASPVEGWRVLVNKLRPGGLMKVGLYSELARREIVETRASEAWARVSPNPEGLRKYRRELIDRYRARVPGLSTIVNSRDFFSMSEFRDLLFHVQEHRFSIPGIQANLEDLGLLFLGFELSDGEGARRFREQYPEPSDTASLSKWHAFEQVNPDTFLGMYQFWVEKVAPGRSPWSDR